MEDLTLDGREAMSTFNRSIPNGHIDLLKQQSDAKNDTEETTFANSGKPSSHGIARQGVDKLKDDAALEKAINAGVDDWMMEEQLWNNQPLQLRWFTF